MGVEFNLISDTAREGYELGKGPWFRLERALRSADPIRTVLALLVDHGFDLAYAGEVAHEVVTFATVHSDWRVIDDSSDISVMTDEERDQELAEERADDIALGYEPKDYSDVLPIYKKVGSCYRRKRELR